jgi:hypothetical protein
MSRSRSIGISSRERIAGENGEEINMTKRNYLAEEMAVYSGGHRRILFALIADEMRVKPLLAQLYRFVTGNSPDVDSETMEFASETISELEMLIEREIDARYPGYAWEYHPTKRGEMKFGGMVQE